MSGEDEYSGHPLYHKFSNMIYRANRDGLSCDLIRTSESFRKFLNYIGPIPEGMVEPTVGRKDHNQGYIIGNYEWQSKSDNSREAILRTMTPDDCSRGGQIGGHKGFQAQMEAGKHPSQTGKSGFKTGIAQKASVDGPNHISKQFRTCPACGRTSVGSKWVFHCENLLCQKPGYKYRNRTGER